MPVGRRTPCPINCPCLCHDGYGGIHPSEDCRDYIARDGRVTAMIMDALDQQTEAPGGQMSDIYAVLNIFTHKLFGPFADEGEALHYIRNEPSSVGFTVLPMHTGKIVDSVSSQIDRIVEDFGPKGQKIQAIKEVRTVTGWGLKESKDAVDQRWDKFPF